MATFLFVHGTGTRKNAYNETIWTIEKHLHGHTVLSCRWGDPLGVRLNMGGASVPGRQAILSEEEALWNQLLSDPFFQLRLLAADPAKAVFDPYSAGPGAEIWRSILELSPGKSFDDTLEEHALASRWQETLARLRADEEFKQLISQINAPPATVSREVARALIASVLIDALACGAPLPSVAARDQMLEGLITPLGGTTKGLFAWYLSAVTRAARNPLTEVFVNIAADVVLYQTRGKAIRDFIASKIGEVPGKVVLVAHSLGGVACVDTLIETPCPSVTHLITVGSQSPFLYEINALSSLPFGRPLPGHFPRRWLNIYDRSDVLSYLAEPVFGKGRVTDFENKSHLPPLAAHSAYWTSPTVWPCIKEFVS
jgi:hypothetical protein